MGANFDSHKFKACSTEELQKKFRILQEDMYHESGNDTYAGHLGIVPGLTILDKVFKGPNIAEDWLSNNTEKWENALAVKVGDFSNIFPKTEADKKLQKDYELATLSINNWAEEIIKRVKAGKSLQKTCTSCQSKIAVKYIKHVNCPVCQHQKFLITPTDEKKKETLVNKHKELEKKLTDSKRKFEEKNKENKAYWIVGAWCAS